MKNIVSKFKQAYAESRVLGDPIDIGSRQKQFLVIATMGCLLIFLAIALLVSETSHAESVNTAVSAWFVGHRTHWLDPIVVMYTMMGDTLFQICLYVIAVVVLLPQRREAIHLVLAGIVVSFSVTVIKEMLDVARPLMVAVPPPSPSFPSGHSAGIATLVSFLAVYFYRQLASRLSKGHWILLGFLMVSMAMTRLYLGVHWLTDVVGGVCLGVAVACLSWLVFDSYAVPRQRQHLALRSAAILIVVALLIYGLIYFDGNLTSYRYAG